MITKYKNKDSMSKAREAVQKRNKNKNEYASLTLVKKIKFWKDKYKDTPNGYFVSCLIGEQYLSDAAKISPSARKKRR